MITSMMLFVCIAAPALLAWIWSRRENYILSWKLNGPFGWPIIGNLLDFRNQEGTIKFRYVIKKKY